MSEPLSLDGALERQLRAAAAHASACGGALHDAAEEIRCLREPEACAARVTELLDRARLVHARLSVALATLPAGEVRDA